MNLFNFGYNITESYSNKLGYFGLFIGGNEISAILVGLSPIVLSYVSNAKSYLLKIITVLNLPSSTPNTILPLYFSTILRTLSIPKP